MSRFGTNLDIFLALTASGKIKDSDFLCKTLLECISVELSPENRKELQVFCRSYVSNLSKRWSKANRDKKTFFKNNSEWLGASITWPSSRSTCWISLYEPSENVNMLEDYEFSLDNSEAVSSTSDAMHATTNTPIQRKPFSELKNKQKKRRSESRLDYSNEEILFAYVSRLKESGKNQMAQIVEYLSKNEEKTKTVYSYLFKPKTGQTLPDYESLALITALKLSKWQYLTLRSTLSGKDISNLPSYHKVLSAKKSCYPPDITVSERGVTIKLQSVLDLTVKQILRVIGYQDFPSNSLKLISKWGFDGASSQSAYKQKPDIAEGFSESSVFMTSFVPLLLMCNDILLWKNPRPSSTNYCRPVMFEFIKETKEYIQQHTAAINQEIANLAATEIIPGILEVTHDLHMTMIDGKVATALSETQSHANCNICLTSPKEMNNLSLVASKPLAEHMYKYGLSSLHMWMRCMECILHISYNMDFKKWAARGQDKLLQKTRKQLTQAELFQQTGLLVDIVKQGFGTSNDGNTARRFFRDFKKSAEITGVDMDLIKRFAVILQTISSEHNINVENFKIYCRETAELYVALYPWYYMPSSVHKLLMHGAEICQHFSFIPIGMMSEEASEARNKDFRSLRERHSRKIGRKETNADIIAQLLISSDPYITHIRPTTSKSTLVFCLKLGILF
ncbi:unnamed protein product [Euphydryas editha]|uniref:Uncharacterized protein n=1 Tax=Euphydryas editha TaxID=104508 RepID=A0AAU9UI34_EUPED|nr:unnamed protein product [Euphydryas editha]